MNKNTKNTNTKNTETKRKEQEEKNSENDTKESSFEFKIPPINELSKEELIRIYQEELKRKDDIIERLRHEKEILFQLSLKHAKRRLEESHKESQLKKEQK